MNINNGHENINQDDDCVSLLSTKLITNSSDRENTLLSNDISYIKMLQESKKKNRRNKGQFHDRMKKLVEFDWIGLDWKLAYILSALLFALVITIVVGIIFFSESLVPYTVCVTVFLVVLTVFTCATLIINSTRKCEYKEF